MSEFANDLLDAIYRGARPFGLGKYKEPDVLLIDDVQQIAGRETAREEFYNILKWCLKRKI